MPSQLKRTREYVEQTFQELDQESSLPLREAVLIRDGHYCGHRFSRGELSAVWFFEEDQIKIYGRDRKLVQIGTTAEVDSYRRAA